MCIIGNLPSVEGCWRVSMWHLESVSGVTVMEGNQKRLSCARWGGLGAACCLSLDQQAAPLLLC